MHYISKATYLSQDRAVRRIEIITEELAERSRNSQEMADHHSRLIFLQTSFHALEFAVILRRCAKLNVLAINVGGSR